ncbi:MAG: UbiD family decarboxylase [Chloroflexota bacterium]|nr:UbiD family decarboxylase [Chloroflexota bacterium]
MNPKDLRTFLGELQERHPDEVLSVDVSGRDFSLAECDAAAILTKLRDRGRRPLLLLDGTKTYDGSAWPGRVLFSVLGTPTRETVALGLEPKASFQQLAEDWSRRIRSQADPVAVSRSEAPVKQNLLTGSDISLFRLPVYRKDAYDARPGWLCVMAVGRAHDGSRYNLSWHRLHVRSAGWAAMRINPRHLNQQMIGYREAGVKRMPVALVVGHHPLFELAASSPCGWETDEYRFAGGILGQPVRVVESETFGPELMVPADAEMVIEGCVDLHRRELCGPWADFMRYYSPQTLEPVFEPTAVSFRDGPIFTENWTGHEAGGRLGATQMFAVLRQRFPGVKAVAGAAPFTIVIQAKLSRPGEGTRLGSFAMGSFGDAVKNVILVDEDIDPWDLRSVMFSVATRVDADSGQVQVFRDLAANRQDPSTERDMRVGGLLIDSTKPVGKPFPPLGEAPAEALDRISLEDYGI